MRPIITRETERAESSQHTTRGSHYICRDFRDFVSRLLLTMTDGKIFYPASITSKSWHFLNILILKSNSQSGDELGKEIYCQNKTL